MQDFAGRTIRYKYDLHGNLVAVTSPAVTGTPNGNDFPEGKTCQYTYSSGYADPRLNHNLLSITVANEVASGGPPRLVAQYQTNTNSPDVDRITQLTIGGLNSSGAYPPAGQFPTNTKPWFPLLPTSIHPVFQNTVADRNGNTARYQFNELGNIVQVRRFPRGDHAQEPALLPNPVPV